MIAALLTLLVPVLWGYALFVFFLAYIPIAAAHERGGLKSRLDPMDLAAYITLGIGLVLDVGFNLLPASIIFAERPASWNETFTKRCRRWRPDDGYRGRFARWVCDRLNVYQDRHC